MFSYVYNSAYVFVYCLDHGREKERDIEGETSFGRVQQ